MTIAIIDMSTTPTTIISDDLREAGLDDLVVIDSSDPLVAQIEMAKPEVGLINVGNLSRDMLEDFFAMARGLDRPIAMFVDQSDSESTSAAIDAGGSAYVFDGLSKKRNKLAIDFGVRRFRDFSRLQRELDEAEKTLARHAATGPRVPVLID